jgi:argininosuccinate lyase
MAAPAAAAVWQARTGSGLHPDLLAFSETTAEDQPFVLHDLCGSAAHVLGLAKAGLLAQEEADPLLAGLRSIASDHQAGRFPLDPALEDAHMNVEARLTAELGDTGRKLHSGRSRNDQVATCIVLYARAGLLGLARALHGLAQALAGQAQRHTHTPWTARTHGLPAQPASLGFLLAAHAHRVQDAAGRALATFHQVGESPLGSGAVAGSTLPLDPAHTAALLGLRPPRSAILATGTRDAVVASCTAARDAGLALASLSQDLLDLFVAGILRLPDGYTTGSSLMPQKRNPDALELARGRGKALAGPLAAVAAITDGLPLGYQRDFQLTKPWLVAALTDAQRTARLLGPLVAGIQVDAQAARQPWGSPGIVATDVAEALVLAGLPFRTAYAVVAEAFARAERGGTFEQALRAQPLSVEHLEAALSAFVPDPSRRATLGGPAPDAVEASLAGHAEAAARLETRIEAAAAEAAIPLRLILPDTPET